jgi:hypothetical protein
MHATILAIHACMLAGKSLEDFREAWQVPPDSPPRKRQQQAQPLQQQQQQQVEAKEAAPPPSEEEARMERLKSKVSSKKLKVREVPSRELRL